MKTVPINKDTILTKLDEIQKDLAKLNDLRKLSLEEFKTGENFAIVEHYLRRALEAVFEIGAHILSRLPGRRASGYKDIAILLGEQKIVPVEFAKQTLVKMAGYRNRMIHFYSEVTKDEMYAIIRDRLNDFDTFSEYIKALLSSPKKFGLSMSP
jgi:uncharacterized protein YutE (UPF0331/DUF86 family)